MTTSAPQGGGNRGYKRSWKNLLINKKYQLRFTLFMVGLSTVLMGGLGFWVMRVANDTTEVAKANALGRECNEAQLFVGEQPPDDELEPDDLEDPPAVPMKLDPAGKAPVPPPEPPDEEDAGSGSGAPRRKIDVILDDMEVPVPPPVPPTIAKVNPDFATEMIAYHQCQMSIPATIEQLERGRLQILLVLIASGLVLVFGLAVYGIKMTHKVAGPLFKVGLYLAKMRDGRLDKVYNLRKGDQLVDFYEHFKVAHAGVVKMQKADIDRAKAVIAAAEAAGAGDHAAVGELRAMVAKKEKSLD